MDILRKMFNKTEEANTDDPKKFPSPFEEKDEFRKPSWFDESDTDDELFGDNRKFVFEVFTNPMELQKHFEHQMQQIMEAVSQFEENPPKLDKDLKGEYLKPGFEGNFLKEFEKQRKMLDTDLDGEIFANQLHSLLQNAGPEMTNILPRNHQNRTKMIEPKKKLSDEETILGRIHGTIMDEGSRPPAKRGSDMIAPPIKTPFGGVFEGVYQGPKMFRQSVMTQTIRKPDGSYETTKITQDSEGNTTTTTTRTINGKSETVTSYNNNNSKKNENNEMTPATTRKSSSIESASTFSDRNIYVSKQGYALPMNLW